MATRRWFRDPATLVVTALAAYRLTRLITTDHLPPMVKARDWLEDRTPDAYSMLWTCPWCIGFWVSAAVVTLGEVADRNGHMDKARVVLLPWALSTVTGVLAEHEVN